MIAVTDDGPGLPADVLEALRSGTLGPRGEGVYVDSGLGLPFCMMACARLGGSLAVEEPSGGDETAPAAAASRRVGLSLPPLEATEGVDLGLVAPGGRGQDVTRRQATRPNIRQDAPESLPRGPGTFASPSVTEGVPSAATPQEARSARSAYSTAVKRVPLKRSVPSGMPSGMVYK